MIPVPPLSVQAQLAIGFALFVPVVLSAATPLAA